MSFLVARAAVGDDDDDVAAPQRRGRETVRGKTNHLALSWSRAASDVYSFRSILIQKHTDLGDECDWLLVPPVCGAPRPLTVGIGSHSNCVSLQEMMNQETNEILSVFFVHS